MANSTQLEIQCPACGKRFPLSEAVADTLRDSVRGEFESEHQRQQDELRKSFETLKNREAELAAQRAAVDKLVEDKLAAQRRQISGKEAELIKRTRELEDRAGAVELEVQKKLTQERDQMKSTLRKTVDDEYSLKLAEKDKIISDIGEQLKDLQRKQEQGSQQLQGEVQELVLEKSLKAWFPTDTIDEVPKGFEGADCIQRVVATDGRIAGSIIWESKRTKNWNDEWLKKLRADQHRASGEVAALVSSALPAGVAAFAYCDGVWVTNLACVQGLATALRRGLLDLYRARKSEEGRASKMDMVYQYLSGPVFAQRVQNIMSAFGEMKADLDKEKAALSRIWSKREKQIAMLVENTASLHGEVSGYLGQDVKPVASLDLESPDGSGS
jgi:hypothetical protein